MDKIEQILADEIVNPINSLLIRDMYYEGCRLSGNNKEYRKYRRHHRWNEIYEHYHKKLLLTHPIVYGHGDYQKYFEEYSWKPCNYLKNIQLFIYRSMGKYVSYLERKLKHL